MISFVNFDFRAFGRRHRSTNSGQPQRFKFISIQNGTERKKKRVAMANVIWYSKSKKVRYEQNPPAPLLPLPLLKTRFYCISLKVALVYFIIIFASDKKQIKVSALN